MECIDSTHLHTSYGAVGDPRIILGMSKVQRSFPPEYWLGLWLGFGGLQVEHPWIFPDCPRHRTYIVALLKALTMLLLSNSIVITLFIEALISRPSDKCMGVLTDFQRLLLVLGMSHPKATHRPHPWMLHPFHHSWKLLGVSNWKKKMTSSFSAHVSHLYHEESAEMSWHHASRSEKIKL